MGQPAPVQPQARQQAALRGGVAGVGRVEVACAGSPGACLGAQVEPHGGAERQAAHAWVAALAIRKRVVVAQPPERVVDPGLQDPQVAGQDELMGRLVEPPKGPAAAGELQLKVLVARQLGLGVGGKAGVVGRESSLRVSQPVPIVVGRKPRKHCLDGPPGTKLQLATEEPEALGVQPQRVRVELCQPTTLSGQTVPFVGEQQDPVAALLRRKPGAASNERRHSAGRCGLAGRERGEGPERDHQRSRQSCGVGPK